MFERKGTHNHPGLGHGRHSNLGLTESSRPLFRPASRGSFAAGRLSQRPCGRLRLADAQRVSVRPHLYHEDRAYRRFA
jgi:hypothetical protein